MFPLFQKVFLLNVRPVTLRQRLSTRTSNDFGRNPKIQEWVLSWKSWWEDQMRQKGAVMIDANNAMQEVITNILNHSQLLR